MSDLCICVATATAHGGSRLARLIKILFIHYLLAHKFPKLHFEFTSIN